MSRLWRPVLDRRAFLYGVALGGVVVAGSGVSGCGSGGSVGTTRNDRPGPGGGSRDGTQAPVPENVPEFNVNSTLGPDEYWSKFIDVPTDSYLFVTLATVALAQGGLVTESTYNDFVNDRQFRAYLLFDREHGARGNVVPAGSYYVGVRNVTDLTNRFSLEVSYIPANDPISWDFDAWQATVLQPGGRAWMRLVIEDGYDLFINGTNTGVNTDIIPAEELSNFRNGFTYQRYTAFANDTGDRNYETHTVVSNELAPGTYYAVARNATEQNQALARWATTWPSLSRGRNVAARTGKASLMPSTEIVRPPAGGGEPLVEPRTFPRPRSYTAR